MSKVELRPYQTIGIRKILNAWDPRRKNLLNVLFQMPTGTGKTTVFSEIVRKAYQKNKRVVIVVHRIELVEQIAERLGVFGVDAGIISGKIPASPHLDVQVATIQTLSRRAYPPADIVIIDECHHAKAATYKKLWIKYPEARFLGVTATPIRLNGDGFDDLFDILISVGKLSHFISKQYLVPIKHLVCKTPDLSEVKQRMRDYDKSMIRQIMFDNSRMANLVVSYLKHIPNKKTIVFAVDVEHSKQIVERYKKANIPAAHLDAKTPKNERKEILQKFRSGEYLILSNVDIVSEGFDVPNCEAVQLARPTKSLALYLQQVGRCMRPSEGKEYGYVLDHAGLWLDHGLSYMDREWKLHGKLSRKKKKNIIPKVLSFDNSGFIRDVEQIKEADGIELFELTRQWERLLIFESIVGETIERKHKIISSIYRYRDYLIENQVQISEVEIDYCKKRMKNLDFDPASGFWYHLAKDIKKGIKDQSQ